MSDGTITRLLHEVESGVTGAEDRLFERIYAELRRMARARLANERVDAAAGESGDLVHEAYQRIGEQDFQNRRHLFTAYARTMQRILVDRARRERSLKRGGDRRRVSINEAEARTGATGEEGFDAVDVAAALKRLRAESPGAADVLRLRYFGGLSRRDISEVLGVDERTVHNDLLRARRRLTAWLATDRTEGQR